MVPNEVVKLLHRDAQLIFFQVLRYFLGDGIQGADNPLVLQGQRLRQFVFHVKAVDIHMDKPGGVPDLIGEVPAGFQLLLGKAHIVSGAVSSHQGKPEGIRAVLLDDLDGIDAVAQGFAHLPALGIPHQPVEEHRFKGDIPHVLQAGENHAGYPEENNIIACHQGVGRIEIGKLRGLFRPA